MNMNTCYDEDNDELSTFTINDRVIPIKVLQEDESLEPTDTQKVTSQVDMFSAIIDANSNNNDTYVHPQHNKATSKIFASYKCYLLKVTLLVEHRNIMLH